MWLATEPLNQSAVVEGSIGQGEGDERVGPKEETSQEEHHMAYQENRDQAETLEDQSADFAGEDTSMDLDVEVAGIWEAAAGAD